MKEKKFNNFKSKSFKTVVKNKVIKNSVKEKTSLIGGREGGRES